ncbi:MAG: hypothetical protein GWN58_27585 [Anaerolineae bacterium]|nr:hypothetical protein [Anaerolineae bacterium]
MSASVSLTAVLTLSGNAKSVSLSYATNYLRVFDFELTAGDLMTLSFDNTTEGTDAQFLFILALNNADATQHTTVSYGFSDADAADPPNGSSWRSVNGLHLSREDVDLSATYKLYIYNSGANKANVTVAVGLDGA